MSSVCWAKLAVSLIGECDDVVGERDVLRGELGAEQQDLGEMHILANNCPGDAVENHQQRVGRQVVLGGENIHGPLGTCPDDGLVQVPT